MATDTHSYVCIWLDREIKSNDNKKLENELRQIYNNFKPFTDCDECEREINGMTDDKIVFITSGGFGRQILPRIHNLSQILTIYIYCGNKSAHIELMDQHPKIKNIFDSPITFVTQLTKDEANRMQAEDGATISIITADTNLETRNALFLWLQLFIEIILHMPHKPDTRLEMLDICREQNKNNKKHMQVIKEFEKNYDPKEAIRWYTRDACFFQLVNTALRKQDYELLFSFRSFITDIAKQIQCEYEKFIRTNSNRENITVYRGQLIGTDELELLKKSIGQFVSMNSFLSTSRERLIAIDFARMPARRENTKPIVFEITIDPSKKTKAFADINQHSSFRDEHEVLIMLGALFYIDNVYRDKENRVWVAQVSLASEDSFQLTGIFAHMKEKIGDHTSLDTLGNLLLRMNENDKARRFYKRMLDETQLAVSDAQLGLGWSCLRCHENDESIEHFNESLRIRKKISGENHASVAQVYGFLGEVYRKKKDNKEAIRYLELAKNIQEKTLGEDSLELAATYDTLGNVYVSCKEYGFASAFYAKTLRIREIKLPSDHHQIAAVHSHIAIMLERQENYDQALDHYKKALTIAKATLPPTHPLISGTEDDIQRLQFKTRL